jgi:hypothetical protein
MTAESLKPFGRTLRVRVPPGQGWPPVGSESCALRVTKGVKRRQRGRRPCGQLRNHSLWTPTLSWSGKATPATPQWPGVVGPPESSSRACDRGSARNLGGPTVSILKQPVGEPGDQNPGPSRVVLAGGGSEARSTGWYRWARKRAYRDGWRGVGATHSTDEAGEPSSKGPGGGKGSPG